MTRWCRVGLLVLAQSVVALLASRRAAPSARRPRAERQAGAPVSPDGASATGLLRRHRRRLDPIEPNSAALKPDR